MANLNLKGLWIPIEILTDKNLSDKEKTILSIILFLSKENNNCFCTNGTISELLNISSKQVSKLINSLKAKGYIGVTMKYKENSKQIETRTIKPIQEKFNTSPSKVLYPSPTKVPYPMEQKVKDKRGVPKEETGREHLDIKEYKEITNFDRTKEKLQNMKLELPDVPEIDDIKIVRWSKKRDEKILEDIIKPKDDLINKLYENNLQMHQQLLRQAKMVEEAEKYQKERNKIMADNRDLRKQVDDIKAEYKEKEDNLECKYDYKIRTLEKENSYLHNVIDRFRETIHKFIEWICVNFDMGTGDTLIRDFERETRTCLDGEEQIKREESEKDLEMER